MWVEVPTLALSNNTVLYIYYGNGAAEPQQDIAGTWSSSYSRVWHMEDNAASTAVADTMAAGNGTSVQNTSALTTTGKITNGLTFNGTTDYISLGAITIPTTGSIFFWWKPTEAPTGDHPLFRSSIASPVKLLDIYPYNTILYGGLYNNGTDKRAAWNPISGVSSGTWYHVAVVWTNGGTTTLYINGVSKATSASLNATFDTSTATTYFGKDPQGGGCAQLVMDEASISSAARTAGWVVTSYNNQNNPAGFQTLASEAPGALAMTGAFTNSAGTFDMNGQIVAVSGSWTNSGSVTSTSSTVTFNGSAGQTVTAGSQAFNNITITNASASGVAFADAFTAANFTDTTAGSALKFQNGTSTTISGTLTLTGASGSLISLNTDDGAAANFELVVSGGAQSLSYVNVRRANAGTNDITCTHYIDGGTNNSDGTGAADWIFSGPPEPTSEPAVSFGMDF